MKRAWKLTIAVSVFSLSFAGLAFAASRELPSSTPAILSSPLFPCSNCHAGMTPDGTKRSLTFHQEIRFREHGRQGMWCFGCHDAADRDRLRLAGGEKVPFLDLPRLCGQCHGNIYRHWKAGIHGKRTGSWDGQKQYYLCTSCHNPHSPKFKPIAPEPAPVKPENTLRGRS